MFLIILDAEIKHVLSGHLNVRHVIFSVFFMAPLAFLSTKLNTLYCLHSTHLNFYFIYWTGLICVGLFA